MEDKIVEKIIKNEKERQAEDINLIASENYVSEDVLEALGSIFTNKYAEGYPGARYYGGNTYSDEIENLCKDRALELFSLDKDSWGVNVQPLSGSPANIAIYSALVPIGGKIMGMELISGGHLSHGHKVSFTGKAWEQVSYTVDKETEVLDYDAIRKKAVDEKPDLIIAGFTAYPRKVDFKKFREIADEVGAYLSVDMSHIAGLVAGGVHPSPFDDGDGNMLADVVMTTTHKTLRGPRSAMIFSRSELSQKIDKAVFPGLQGGPHLNQIAGVAVALQEAMSDDFKKYAENVVKNAKILSDLLIKYGFRMVSGGTDTHLLLVDTWKDGEGISGKEASERLEKEGIIANMNTVPFDTRKPMSPSGVRFGTAAITTKGADKKYIQELAEKINKILI